MIAPQHLPCPNQPAHTMNFSGIDRSGRRLDYLCHACPGQKVQQIFTGRVVVANDRLIQVTIDAQPALGVLDAERGGLRGGPFRIGERVLVLIGTRRSARAFARAVYRAPTPPARSPRRYGRIDELTTPDHGWIRTEGTNERVFVHVRQTIGKIMRRGQRVSFVLAYVPGRGWQATQVRAA